MQPHLLKNIISLSPIGFVHSTRKDRTDDSWNHETTYLQLDEQQFHPDSLLGLIEFSHLEIIFWMHQVNPSEITTGSRHPRNRLDLPKVGIFAQRGSTRPNQLGLSCCKIKEIDNLSIYVEDFDAIDGTPILDIKPYFQEFGPQGDIKQPEWVFRIMKSYWF